MNHLVVTQGNPVCVLNALAALRSAFPEYQFEPMHWGDWIRIWIRSKDGVQLGRINLQPGKLPGSYEFYSIKSYKKSDWDYDPMDNFFLQVDYWRFTGRLLDIPSLIEEAKRRSEERKAEILSYRKAHPTARRRPAIKGRWIGQLHKLIAAEVKKVSPYSKGSV